MNTRNQTKKRLSNRAEGRFTHTVIVGRFRAILFQALCLALNFVCLVGALCQTNPIVDSAEEKSYHPPFWMWSGQEQNENPQSSVAEITKWRKEIDEANELWLKQDTDKGIPKFENLLRHTELVFGKDSPEVGLVVSRIGLLYIKRADFERALPYLERSLKLVSPLPDNAENLGTQTSIGVWQTATGPYFSPMRTIRAWWHF